NGGMMGSATDNDANSLEMAKAITKLPHLVNPQDATATLDARARSYLQRIQSQHPFRRVGVAENAFGATGEMPHLFSDAPRRPVIGDSVSAIHSRRRNQIGIRLLLVPQVGVPAPQTLLQS